MRDAPQPFCCPPHPTASYLTPRFHPLCCALCVPYSASLKAVDDAMFVLTLEDDAPADDTSSSRCMLHGAGRNRWFDKCFNVVVCANGRAGIAWEHAWGDGVAVLNFFNTVYDEMVGRSVRPPSSAVDVAALDWRLSPGTRATISAAEARLQQQIKECELNVYQTGAMTKSDIKKSGLSPDGVMQMCVGGCVGG